MKTFINVARFAAIALLFVSLSSFGLFGFGGGCCAKKACAPRTQCVTGCKLQPEPVMIRKSCDKPGFYKQVCHLEYEPCEGTVEEYEAIPVFKGCYDEQGNLLSR